MTNEDKQTLKKIADDWLKALKNDDESEFQIVEFLINYAREEERKKLMPPEIRLVDLSGNIHIVRIATDLVENFADYHKLVLEAEKRLSEVANNER